MTQQLVTLNQAILNMHEIYEKHFRGTKQEHQIVQESLRVIQEYCYPAKQPEAEPVQAEVVQS